MNKYMEILGLEFACKLIEQSVVLLYTNFEFCIKKNMMINIQNMEKGNVTSLYYSASKTQNCSQCSQK